jgi:hypothetical protein
VLAQQAGVVPVLLASGVVEAGVAVVALGALVRRGQV